MSLPDSPFIFVSYANKDAAFVHPEIERLKNDGYQLWYDQEELEPARFWDEEIRKAITACACFMVFITEDSIVSKHVCEEIEQALSENKPFIGIYWDNVELPAGLQEVVRKRQTLDRYSMHQSAYERPLSNALSEHIRVPLTPRKAAIVPPPDPPPPDDRLPKVVFFVLIAAALISLFLAGLFNITPDYISRNPVELAHNRVMGLILGGMFVFISLGLSGAAFVVFRMYLRRRND
jgi:TIR domain